MIDKQIDYLVSLISRQNKILSELSERVKSLSDNVKNLENKTVVISDVDKEITQLKIDVKSLVDEKEA